MTPTEPQFSLFASTRPDTMTDLLEAATEIVDASTQTYLAGLDAIVEQQELAQQACLEWISEVTSVQSGIREKLADRIGSVTLELTDEAEQATSLTSRRGAQVVKTGRDAASSASKRQPKALTGTTRRTTRTTAKSLPASPSQASPARWTGEAYESLTAPEVNEALPQFSQRELRDLETYEKAHQSRQKVLDKISALQGEEPVPGYDELSVQEIHRLLTDGDEKLSASVREYERPRKNRAGVLRATDAKLSKS